jgi:hypothetical protein
MSAAPKECLQQEVWPELKFIRTSTRTKSSGQGAAAVWGCSTCGEAGDGSAGSLLPCDVDTSVGVASVGFSELSETGTISA